MENSLNFWKKHLSLLDKNHPEKIDALLAIQSQFESGEYNNNLGVLYEKIGDPLLAKIYFLKSLSHDLLNIQVWKNFNSVVEFQPGIINIKLLLLYFLQSKFVIQSCFFLCLVFSIYVAFKVLQEKMNYLSVFKKTVFGFSIIFLLFFINTQNIFYATKEKSTVHAGPSKVFRVDNQYIEKGTLLIVVKKNNGYSKVLGLVDNRIKWVSSTDLISI